MNQKTNLKAEYRKFKKRNSFLSKIAKKHNLSKSHVCNIIAGRRSNPKVLADIKKSILD